MSDVQPCDWRGQSGQVDRYWTYPLPASFNASQDGNYIFTSLDASRRWVPIYFDQANVNDRANSHHQAACLRARGATHFHCHLNPAERDRLAEEADLLASFTQAYQPTGCNERVGG
jgi:hypothetical protein